MLSSSSLRAVYAAVFGVWLLLIPAHAVAETGASRLHVSYDVPPGCPSQEDFIKALESRIQTSWIKGFDTRSFDVRVTQLVDGRFAGRLDVHQIGRASRTREIRSTSCKAVTTSLAVFVAIALDPASEATRAGEDLPSEPEDVEKGEHVTEELHPATVPAPRSSEAPPRATALPTARPSLAAWTWSAGYAVTYLRAPEPSWGGRVHAELARAYAGTPFGSALRLSWGWSDFSTFPSRAGEAEFRLRTGRVEGCATFELAPFVGRACAGVDVGRFSGTTSDVPRFSHVSTSWTAGTGALRAGVSITQWLLLELSAGVLVPFERPTFALREPTRFVYRAPGALFEGSAGVVATARFR